MWIENISCGLFSVIFKFFEMYVLLIFKNWDNSITNIISHEIEQKKKKLNLL